MSDLSAEELEVGRRNLLAQLKRELRDGKAELYPLDAGTVRDLVEVLEGVRAMPSHAQIQRAIRERLVDSNFSSSVHEPIRTQIIDTWADCIASAVSLLITGAES